MSDKFIKIGYTNNLDRRLETLQIGNPLELELLHVILHETAEEAEEHEAKLHHKFRRHHLRGEWFRARPLLRYIRKQKRRVSYG